MLQNLFVTGKILKYGQNLCSLRLFFETAISRVSLKWEKQAPKAKFMPGVTQRTSASVHQQWIWPCKHHPVCLQNDSMPGRTPCILTGTAYWIVSKSTISMYFWDHSLCNTCRQGSLFNSPSGIILQALGSVGVSNAPSHPSLGNHGKINHFLSQMFPRQNVIFIRITYFPVLLIGVHCGRFQLPVKCFLSGDWLIKLRL